MDLWSRQHRVETRDSVLSNTSPEALQQRRNESLDTFLRHSLVSGVLAFIGVAVGIANVVVGLDDALLGYKLYQAGRDQQREVDTGFKAKCYLFAHYTLNLITIFVALAFVALSIVGIVWCSGEVQYYYVKINKVEYPRNVTCPEDKTAALVIGGMAAFDSFLMAVWCTLGTFFFCCYYRAFGIESKGRGKHWS